MYIRPTIERTKEQILGEKMDIAIFVLSAIREKDEPLDLDAEVFVSHRGVVLDIGQFAVYIQPSSSGQRGAHCLWCLAWENSWRNGHQIAKDLIEYAGRSLHSDRTSTKVRQLGRTAGFAYRMLSHRC